MHEVNFDENWTTLKHGNPSFVEEIRMLPGGYYLRMGAEGNMKLSTSALFAYYKGYAYRHKTESLTLKAPQFREVLNYVGGMMHDRMIRNCSNFKLPYAIGSMCVEQIKTPSKKRYNIGASMKAGRKVYDHRPETGGKTFCVTYHGKQAVSRHMRLYYFRGRPDNKYFEYSGNKGVVEYAKRVSREPGVLLYSCRPLKC